MPPAVCTAAKRRSSESTNGSRRSRRSGKLAMHRSLVSICFCVQAARLSWCRSAVSANVRCCSSSPSSRPPQPRPSISAKPGPSTSAKPRTSTSAKPRPPTSAKLRTSTAAKPVAQRAGKALKQDAKYWSGYRGAERPPGVPSEYLVVLEERVSALADLLMYRFDSESERRLLVQSMLHKSCVGSTIEIERSGELMYELPSAQCNDRLEWLGDRVLGLLIAQFLHEALPELEEGQLTLIYSGLNSRRRFNEIARELGLAEFLVCSRHIPENPGGRMSSRIGSFLEAVLGALYLAGGEAAVKVLFEARIRPLLWKMMQEGERNWKGELLELVCKYGLDHLDGSQFRIVELQVSARDRASVPWLTCFRSGIFIHDQVFITAMESSKRKAHQAVCKAFLLELEEAGGEGGALAGFRALLGDDTRNWRADLFAFLREKCQLDVSDWRQLRITELPLAKALENGASADDCVKAGVFIHGRLVASGTSSTKFLARRAACRVFLKLLEAADNPKAIIDDCRGKR